MKNKWNSPQWRNMEKSGFRKGQFIGYGGGNVYRISRISGGYIAINQNRATDSFQGKTLSDISFELMDRDVKTNPMKKTRRNPIKGAWGKFGGESYVAKWVYETADGTDELGSVDELGWYVKYSGKVKGRGPFHLIVREDSQGFVRGEFYNTEKELDRAWNGIERAYDEFYGEQDDN